MKPLSFLLIIACAAVCLAKSATNSLEAAVRKALSRFENDSLRIDYSFGAVDLMHPDRPKGSAWDPSPKKSWVYASDHGIECKLVDDLKIVGQGFRGIVIESRKARGNGTEINGWELVADGRLHFSLFGVSLTRSGDTAFKSAGGTTGFGGSLGRITRAAIYFNGIDVYPIAEPEYRDTLVYQDDSGNRTACPRISSIAINLSNDFDYSGHMATGKDSRIKTIRCAMLPKACPIDTAELILRGINEAISGFEFTIRNEDSAHFEAIFRTRADCERYAKRFAEKAEKTEKAK